MKKGKLICVIVFLGVFNAIFLAGVLGLVFPESSRHGLQLMHCCLPVGLLGTAAMLVAWWKCQTDDALLHCVERGMVYGMMFAAVARLLIRTFCKAGGISSLLAGVPMIFSIIAWLIYRRKTVNN